MAVKIPILTQFDASGINQAKKQVGGFGASLKKGLRVAGLIAGVAAGIALVGNRFAKMAEEARIADARLEQIAASMGLFGSATGEVTGRLKAFADANKFVLGVDDEVIKSTQAKLLTFRELAKTADETGGVFDRATKAAFDLAAGGFGSAESSAIKLGKALQDPITNINALSRAGVQFNDSEKQLIQTLVESGKVLEAQDIILGKVEAKVGGLAEATASSSSKITIAFGEIGESIGTAVLPLLDAFANYMVELTPQVDAFFANLTDPTTEMGEAWYSMLGAVVNFGNTFNEVFGSINSSGILKFLIGLLETVFIGLSQIVWVAGDAGKTLEMLFSGDFAGAGKQFGTFLDRYNGFVQKLYTDIDNSAKSMGEQFKMPPKITPQIDDYKGPGAGKKAGAKAGKDFGKGFANSAADALAKEKALIQEALTAFTESTPIGDEWEKYGSKLGNEIVKGLQKSLGAIAGMGGLKASDIKNISKGLKTVYDRVAILQDRIVERSKFQEQLRGDILSTFDFSNLGKGVDSIIKKFRKQVEQTKQFRDNLATLGQQGLNQDLYRKLVDNMDFASAAQLVKGGASAVSELNGLYGELQTFASDITTSAGNQLYNLGVDAGTGFIRTLEDGLGTLSSFAKMKQKEASLSAAIAQLVNYRDMPNSQRGMVGALSAAQKAEINAQIAALVETRATLQKTKSFNNLGMQSLLDSYFAQTGQMATFTATGAYAAPQRSSRGGQVINLNVNGGINTSLEIGREIIKALKAYERANGVVVVGV